MTPSVAAEVAAPPDNCSHPEWHLGCPRCFWEMKGIAEGTIQVERDAAGTAEQGAILFGWHILMILKDVMAQVAPTTRSLDLKVADNAVHVYTQVKMIDEYVTGLVASPAKLAAALAQAGQIAQAVRARMQREQQPTTAPVVAKSSIVLTD